jgi:1-acyl-sn-glycerol-3-phosphate acyltransferase
MDTVSWGDVVRRGIFGTHPDRRDRPYRLVVRLTLALFHLLRLRFDVRGHEHVPTAGGAVICSNHISYLDFTLLGYGALQQRRLVRFMAKASVFAHWFSGPFMRAMQHIPVDRKAGAAAFDAAVRALADGQLVGVFPEATISQSFTVKELKAGAARMALDAGVPIIPAAVWGGQRVFTKKRSIDLTRGRAVTVLFGQPIVPQAGETTVALLARTRGVMVALLEEAQRSYPQQPAGPEDLWWVPAHLGGTAPTQEEAAARDREDAAGKRVRARTSRRARLRARLTRRPPSAAA